LHTLIVGTSGTGKTTGFVDQNIAVLSSTSTKPSMVITDPKKELYLKHNAALKKRGYRVFVLDLRSPYTSKRWNPFSVLQRRILEVRELDDALEKLDRAEELDSKEKKLRRAEAEVRRQQLTDEIEDLSRDVIYTLCPVRNKEQPSWEEGARNLILGFLLALCEDAMAGRIDVDKVILFNVYQNVTKYCGEDTTMLKNYLLTRDEFSKVKTLANTVLVTSDRTLTSYLSDVNGYMQQLADDGILSMTSDSEINLFSLDERPTAIFIVIPDEKKTRHSFVTLFISQLYKELTEKCNMNLLKRETDDIVLKRKVYFILDEFGNIPEIRDMDSIITVARSRGMRFLLILQSLTQLENVYGRTVAADIKNNCNVKIFIGSDDGETKKEFSQLCGQRKIKALSVNTSVSSDPSSSISAHEAPLITEAQLQRLNGDAKGDAIISVRGYRPIWGHFTPSFELKDVYFPEAFTDTGKDVPRMFKKSELFVDIEGILPEPPRSDEDREAWEAYERAYTDFINKWEEDSMENTNRRAEETYAYLGDGGDLSAEDEEYLLELALEEEAAAEPEPDEDEYTLEGQLRRDFPELADANMK
ncbi:MAG: type IV secretory system conjugative DNA transfer family protein, partial [Bacteroidales bacterium]|nr:type IV secretory system conjugative DNA transfer family protein [Bacteroidales bacterium]